MAARPSDAELIARARQEPETFMIVYERRYAAVHNFLRRRVGSQLADDLAAEVFLRAWARTAAFRPQHATALPWLYGIATHVVGDHRRGEKKHLAALQGLARVRTTQAPESAGDDLERIAVSADLAEGLRRLPARDRDAFLLVCWADLTYEQAADALDVPIGTLRSRVHRARQRLLAALDSSPYVLPTRGEAHV